MADPEIFWSQLLSRKAAQTREAWQSINAEEKSAVLAHLKRMVSEEGWSEPQRISAQAALDVIEGPDESGSADAN